MALHYRGIEADEAYPGVSPGADISLLGLTTNWNIHLKHCIPTQLGHICQCTSDSLVPELPSYSFEYRVGIRHRLKLELWRWWKFESCETFVGSSFLLWVVLPLDIALPAWSLLFDLKVRIAVFTADMQRRSTYICDLGGLEVECQVCLVPETELGSFETLLELPLIRGLERPISLC